MLSKNLQEIPSDGSEICNFYAGKNIFITGAAGFLGTVLLETLLRCCSDISKIYILLRPKKGMLVEERKNAIFEKDVFIKLKAINPDSLKKVIAITGDTSQDHLGMNENDYNKLTKEVSIVFHIAATISFTKPLGFIVRQNVIATSNVVDFCRKLENLEVLVYTSSVYSNCNQKDVIEEKIYDLPFLPEEIIQLGRNNDEYAMLKLYSRCSPPFPNFYAFSKCVTENFLKEKAQDLPVCIIRPSIIFTSLKGALPGYMEQGSAMMDLTVGVAKGFVRVIAADKHKKIEIIPVDVTANAHIVAAFHQATKSLPSPSVYNCVAGELASHTWGSFIGRLLELGKTKPCRQAYLYPTAMCCKNPTLYTFLTRLLHYIPAVIFDLLLWLSGSKVRLYKIYKFYDAAMKSVNFFTMHDWDMKNDNFQSLSKGLNAVEEEMFSVDLSDLTIEELKRTMPMGAGFYRENGKHYEENFKSRYLRYFLTFSLVWIILGCIFLIFYLIFKILQKQYLQKVL